MPKMRRGKRVEGCDDDGKSGRSDDRRKAVMMTGSTEDGAREFAASGRTTAGTGTGVPRATAKQRAARIRELRRQKAPADKTQELPIDEGYSKTFLRVTVAVAVFLFAITLAGVLGINSMFENSRQQVVSNFTVQVLPLPGTDASRKDLLAVVGFLEKYPDVEQVTVLSDAELRALLEPWLGNNVDVEMLPIPKLLDVKIRNAKNFDYKELTVRLSEVSPQASINDHNLWLSRLLRFINSLKMLAVTVLILVAGGCVASIVYAAKTRDYYDFAYDGGDRRIYCRQLCQADYPDVGGGRSYRRGSGGAGNSGYRAYGAGN